MKYKFLGKPDRRFPHLVTGDVYDLEIRVDNGVVFNRKEKPIITSPIHCPYSSWDTFYANWQKVLDDVANK